MFSPDPYIGDATNSQDYNKYSYVRNNPLKYTDPTGNLAWFVPIIYAAVNVGVDLAINNGKMNFGQICMSAAKGAIGGVVGGGAIISVGGAFIGAGMSQMGRLFPSIPIYQSENFNLSMSPSFGMGSSGPAMGLNLDASGKSGDFSFSGSVGTGFGSGVSTLGENISAFSYINIGGSVGYTPKNTTYGAGYSSNWFGGDASQRIGAWSGQIGDFSFRVDEDLVFFGDGEDRYRTAGVFLTYRYNNDLTLAGGFSLTTGDATFNNRIPGGRKHRGYYDNCKEKHHNLRAGIIYGGAIYKQQAYFTGHNSEKALHGMQDFVHRTLTKNSGYFENRMLHSKTYHFQGTYNSNTLYY